MINLLRESALVQLARHLLGESSTDLRGLLFPWYQSDLVSGQRAALVISRVRLIALTFALLTPSWIILDITFFPVETSVPLAAARLVASLCFAVLSVAYKKSTRITDAYIAIAALFAIPTAFFGVSHFLLMGDELGTGFAASLIAGYAFLPFVMTAGLSVFPLSAIEGMAFALPAILVQIGTGSFGAEVVSEGAQFGLAWLLILIAAVAVLSGMSQLHYLSEIIMKASRDPLTKAYNRAAGREMLEKYFLMASRNETPLALIFVDLDNFKSVNDTWGHEAGDDVLRGAAARVTGSLRRVDLLVRWGGEEFLIVAPLNAADGTRYILRRLFETGLGERPDGKPMTASLGQAEYLADRPESLAAFIEIADKRMYRAKSSGKDRLCFGDGENDMTPVGGFSERTAPDDP